MSVSAQSTLHVLCRMAGFLWLAHSVIGPSCECALTGAQMELHELRQGVLKELEATAAAERTAEVP